MPIFIAMWRGFTITQEADKSFAIKRDGVIHGRGDTAWECLDVIDQELKGTGNG